MKYKWLNAVLISLLLLTAGCQTAASPDQNSEAPDEPLTNTYWRLDSLNGKTVTGAENFREAHIVLHNDNHRLAGSTGCNTLVGSYRVARESLTFGQIATTKMACPEAQMRNEQAMLTILGQVGHWQVSGSTLSLKDADGNLLALFEAVHLF
ncbi:META domain-containing protein [Vreelandella olivaria]|uniref:META domain-containing protein n=1 Tax=Vreelandella olivaria TaxID=390919 RepID=UPI00201E779F|nr:META domain-containing protein [Halomonas olivaria]